MTYQLVRTTQANGFAFQITGVRTDGVQQVLAEVRFFGLPDSVGHRATLAAKGAMAAIAEVQPEPNRPGPWMVCPDYERRKAEHREAARTGALVDRDGKTVNELRAEKGLRPLPLDGVV